MKPMIIVQPDVMSEADIELLRKNDICVVVAKDPSKVKFVDPIPAASSRNQIENAAIQLSRILLNRQWTHVSNCSQIGHAEISRLYIDALIQGTELDRNGSQLEQETRIYNSEKADELRRLAREEAKAERAALKKK